jgi:predicted amidophosphoribosyltransferase
MYCPFCHNTMPNNSESCAVCGWKKQKFQQDRHRKYKKNENRKRNHFLNSLKRLEREVKYKHDGV